MDFAALGRCWKEGKEQDEDEDGAIPIILEQLPSGSSRSPQPFPNPFPKLGQPCPTPNTSPFPSRLLPSPDPAGEGSGRAFMVGHPSRGRDGGSLQAEDLCRIFPDPSAAPGGAGWEAGAGGELTPSPYEYSMRIRGEGT